MSPLHEIISKAKQSMDMVTCDLMDAHELASPVEKIVISSAFDDARELLNVLVNLEAAMIGDSSDAACT